MSEKVYKKVDLVGCSNTSIENAVALAIEKASASVRGLSWFEVREIRGAIHEGKPTEWQVTLTAGFKLE
jgi:flavin-binding protein dodecin